MPFQKKRRFSLKPKGPRTYKRRRFSLAKKKGATRMKFGATKSLNYRGVAFRKETLITGLRFSYLSGTGTSDGQYVHSAFVTAAGPTNWANIKQLYGQYQLRGFKIKMFPPSTNTEVSSSTAGSIYEPPVIYWKKDTVDNVDWASIDEAAQAQAKSRQFTRPIEFYVQCKPEISLNTTGDVKIPVDSRKTWIPTESDTVKHRGMKFLLADMNTAAYGTGTMTVRAQVTYYYGLKMQE